MHHINEQGDDEYADINGNDKHQRCKQRSMDLTDFGENEIGRDSDDEHYHEHHQENKEPKKDDSLTLGHKETHAVHAGKCLVFVVLILTAMTMAILMYWFTKQEEWKTFKTKFQSIAMQLLNTYGQ